MSVFLEFKLFCNLYFPLQRWLPIELNQLVSFIGYKLSKGYAYMTVRSCVSALSFIQNMLGFYDVTKHFLVCKALSGYRKIKPSKDTRYPITIEILKHLLLNVRYISQNSYEIVLFKAVCVLAFFGFFEDWRNNN